MRPSAPFLLFGSFTQTPDPCAGVLSIDNDGCGTLTAVVTGGGPGPFSFSWTGPGGFASAAPSITPLVAGTYNVTRVSCRENVSINFTPPQPLAFCACIDNAAKFPRTLHLHSFTGGSGAYTYSINGGADTPVTLPETFIPIPAAPGGGVLQIVVKDANCIAVTPVTKNLYCPNLEFVFFNALEFDGVNDFIETTALIGTPIPAEGTIVTWFKPGETPDFGGAIHGADNSNGGQSRGMLWCGDPSLGMYLRVTANDVRAVIGTTTITRTIKPPYIDPDFRGGWMFAAMTWKRNAGVYTFNLYVGDDITGDFLTAAGTNNTYAAANFAGFNWGARQPLSAGGDNYGFYGFMDELRYFNRALDACEVECLFNNGAGNNHLDLDTNLRVLYRLNETGGNVASNAGTGGGALDGLLRGFSGVDGANDTTWRTSFGSLEAWRLHAAGPQGVDYPGLSFRSQGETVDLRYYINNGDSFTIFTEVEFHHSPPPLSNLSRALLGVFRPTNSRMHGQPQSAIEVCQNPVHPWDCGIFDARVNETTGLLTVQIANLNDVLGTSVSAPLTNWQNRKVGLAFSVDAATKTLRVFYNDGGGGGSVEIINAVYDDVTPDAFGNVWTISSAQFGGALLFGSPCPFTNCWDGSACGALGLISQTLNMYDLHVYNSALNQATFDGWFNEALGTTMVGAFNVRNERSLIPGPSVQRRFRPMLKPGDFTALVDTGPTPTDGLLYKAPTSFFTRLQTGPNPNPCAVPTNDFTATFNPLAGVPGWVNNRHIPTGTAWLID